MAKILQEIMQVNFKIIDEGYGVALEIGLIKGFEDDFESHEWSNRGQARQLINEAKTIISSNRATKQTLGPIVSQLYNYFQDQINLFLALEVKSLKINRSSILILQKGEIINDTYDIQFFILDKELLEKFIE